MLKLYHNLTKTDSLANKRLALMILTCFTGFLRISECLRLRPKDFQFSDEHITLNILEAKTDKFRDGQNCYISCGRVSKLFRIYLNMAKIDKNDTLPLFRNCKRNTLTLKTLSYGSATSQLKCWLKKLSLPAYTWHSFRAGGASLAFQKGIAKELIMRQGRWKSHEGIAPYLSLNNELKKKIPAVLSI